MGQDLGVLRNALAELPGLEAEVVLLRFLVDLSPEDIAHLQFSGLQSLG